jgi:hypothetical protein
VGKSNCSSKKAEFIFSLLFFSMTECAVRRWRPFDKLIIKIYAILALLLPFLGGRESNLSLQSTISSLTHRSI